MNGKVRGLAIASLLIAALCFVGCAGGGDQHGGNDQVINPNNGIKQSVNDYSWEELSSISQQIGASGSEEAALEIAQKYNLTTAEGKLDGTQVKSFQLSDGTNVVAQITGFYHDNKSDGTGKAGISFITKNIISKQKFHDRTYDDHANKTIIVWENSDIRTWMEESLPSMLPQDVSDVVTTVDKLTNNPGSTGGSTSAVTTTSDMLWFYSGVELCGESTWDKSNESTNEILNAEGTQYKLFADMGASLSGSNRILQKTGEDDSWWLRSAYLITENRRIADSHGAINANASMVQNRGVVFGFCI